MIHFLIIALTVFFALTVVKRILQALHMYFYPSPRNPQHGKPSKTKEDYKDVKDAKFVELPDKKTEDTSR